MWSRALSLAMLFLLIGFGATDTVLAQATNLEAGKAPSQLFAQTCNACHKSPRGLLKTVPPGSLPGFLRQHYTTSPDMAGALASYLVSNGAADTRHQAKDAKKDGAREKEAAPAPEGRQKRAARPGEEGAKESAKPEASGEQAPEGRKSKRLGKRGKPSEDAAAAPDKKDEPKVDSKADSKPEPKSDSAKVDSGRDESKPDTAKASDKASEKPAEPRPDSAKVEPSGSEAPALRPDPVPPVTPAPEKPAEPVAPKPTEAAAPKAAEPAASGSPEPAAKPQEPPSPAAAPPAPAQPAGPPAPPISR